MDELVRTPCLPQESFQGRRGYRDHDLILEPESPHFLPEYLDEVGAREGGPTFRNTRPERPSLQVMQSSGTPRREPLAIQCTRLNNPLELGQELPEILRQKPNHPIVVEQWPEVATGDGQGHDVLIVGFV